MAAAKAATLATLARLSRLDDDAARQALGHAAVAEHRAHLDVNEAHSRRTHELAAATHAGAPPGALARWLPVVGLAIATAQATLALKESERAAAAVGLARCKAALKAVATLQAERDKVSRRTEARRTQLRLDEMGRRPG